MRDRKVKLRVALVGEPLQSPDQYQYQYLYLVVKGFVYL